MLRQLTGQIRSQKNIKAASSNSTHPRILTGVGGEGQHPTVGRSKARMGARLLGRAMLRPDGCGNHHLRFCGNEFAR